MHFSQRKLPMVPDEGDYRGVAQASAVQHGEHATQLGIHERNLRV